MINNKSKGMVEAEISDAIVSLKRTIWQGRGDEDALSTIDHRQQGATRAEEQLAKSGEGLVLIKKIRVKLLKKRPLLKAVVDDATACVMKSMHTDISTVTGERIIVFVMDRNVEKALTRE